MTALVFHSASLLLGTPGEPHCCCLCNSFFQAAFKKNFKNLLLEIDICVVMPFCDVFFAQKYDHTCMNFFHLF